MFSKFNEEAQKVLIMAKKEMVSLKHPYVGSEHLFLSLLKESKQIQEEFLRFNVTYSQFRDELVRIVGLGTEEHSLFLYTPLLKRILENAAMTARDTNSSEVTSTHLLLALIEEGEGVALRVLSTMNVNIDEVYEKFSAKLVDKKEKYKKRLLIEEFGVDLTKKAGCGEIDPVIGREDEINRVIEILSRRGKNNPLLVGDAGVGKTAIVEELARKITLNDVPLSLRGKRIIAVEIASLVAGTKYRGEFEERIHKILKEVESRDDILIFIDEVHTLVGAGGAEGAIDASNILKPSLARGKLRLIGATTREEYQQTIEKDKAFDRRFQKVEVLEPSDEKTYSILKELKPLYCSFHGVTLEDGLLKKIIELTNQYIYNRKQPDKAIDLLDEVCAKVCLQKDHRTEKLSSFNQELSVLKKSKQDCIQKQNFEEALSLREQERELISKINTLSFSMRHPKPRVVQLKDIQDVLYSKTHIPILGMDSKTMRELSKLEDQLNQKIIGQSSAIKSLCDATKRIQFGLQHHQKPFSFLFVGPTGVGKTQLVKEYAKYLHRENDLIRLDMSEYRESHSISKIIGSPSGYVGYDDGKNILEKIRNHPYSILLLDEIEKAHPAVLNLFLQALDEGFMNDSVGRKIYFDHTIIIMTSNIGFGKEALGFCEDTSSVYSKLKEFLSIEFINRIDQVLVFKSLQEESIRKIIQNQLRDAKKVFFDRGIHLSIQKKVSDEILELSEYSLFGARKIRQIITSKLDAMVIQELLQGKKKIAITHLEN